MEGMTNSIFPTESIFFDLVNRFPHHSFSCSHTTSGRFRGMIAFVPHAYFTTDDIAVVQESYKAKTLRELSDHCYEIALALAKSSIF